MWKVVESIVKLYNKGEYERVAELHRELQSYMETNTTKTSFKIPDFIVELMQRIPHNTVWLNSHQEGSHALDIETHTYIFTALQTTSAMVGAPANYDMFNSTTNMSAMKRPIFFSPPMKVKE